MEPVQAPLSQIYVPGQRVMLTMSLFAEDHSDDKDCPTHCTSHLIMFQILNRGRSGGEETEPFETDESAATPPPPPGISYETRYVGYGITDSWDEIVETLQGAPVSYDQVLGAHRERFFDSTMVRRDKMEIYMMLVDDQCQRQLFASLGKSMDASDLARAEVMSLRTTVHAQMSEITELQSADRSRRRAVIVLLETERAGDSFTGTGDDITGAGYCITGTAGTRWGDPGTAEVPEEADIVIFFVIEEKAPKEPQGQHRSHKTPSQQQPHMTVHYAQTPAMIDQGVVRLPHVTQPDGVDSHTSGTGVRGLNALSR
ncbi:hypothetical protein Tco_0622883 [Tanacetum coccineum]